MKHTFGYTRDGSKALFDHFSTVFVFVSVFAFGEGRQGKARMGGFLERSRGEGMGYNGDYGIGFRNWRFAIRGNAWPVEVRKCEMLVG